MLAIIGAFVVLVTVNELMSPLPDAANPIFVLSLVQEETVPVTVLEKLILPVVVLLQRTKLVGWFTVGTGFTVTVAVMGEPAQATKLFV